MKELIKQYEEQADAHRKKAVALDAAVKAIQDVCEHDYQPTGGESHNRKYFECSKCLHVTHD